MTHCNPDVTRQSRAVPGGAGSKQSSQWIRANPSPINKGGGGSRARGVGRRVISPFPLPPSSFPLGHNPHNAGMFYTMVVHAPPGSLWSLPVLSGFPLVLLGPPGSSWAPSGSGEVPSCPSLVPGLDSGSWEFDSDMDCVPLGSLQGGRRRVPGDSGPLKWRSPPG